METLLTRASFEEYLRDHRMKGFPAQGVPKGKILVDPQNGRVQLRLLVEALPDLTLSERLRWETLEISSEGHYLGQLSVQADEKMYEAYLLISDIASEFAQSRDLQLSIKFATARFAELIEMENVLSPEKQLGLIGELLVLREVEMLLPKNSLRFWVGPEKSEHDFKFPHFDLEVKTTSSEARKHKIGSVQQLLESPGRELFLASIQLTMSTEGSGFSLGDLVNSLRETFTAQGEMFIEKLHQTGWRLKHNHLYTMKFAHRSEPLAFTVDENFPRVLSEHLTLNPGLGPRISDIEYRINLEDLEPRGELSTILRIELENA